MLIISAPGLAVLRAEFLCEAIGRKRRKIAHAKERYVAAASGVAAARTAFRGFFIAQPADDAIASFPRLSRDSYFVYECHFFTLAQSITRHTLQDIGE
jgi:hypothetical protein